MAQNWEMVVEFRNLSSGSLFSRVWNSSVGKDTGRAEGVHAHPQRGRWVLPSPSE